MSEWQRFGNPADFALDIRWIEDPEPPARRPAAYGWSMGQLGMHVAGVNVTETALNGERQPYVGWYLSPLLHWLATNWAALLHEEHFPWPGRGNAPAAVACNRALDEWIAAEDPPGREHYARSQNWYFRHGVRTAAAGGIFPDLFLRRIADDIELSWSGAPMEFTRAGLAFASGAGQARLPVGEVAEPIWNLLRWVVDHPPDAPARYEEDMTALASAVESVRHMGEFELAKAHASEQILQTARAALDTMGRMDLLMHPRSGDGASVPCMTELPPAVAMFGGVSPQLSVGDVEYLCELLAAGHGGSDGAELAALVADRRDEPLGVPYEDGSRFASELLEDVDVVNGDFVDVRALCERLAIAIEETDLDTDTIRGVALAGDGFSPRVVVNKTHYFNSNESGQRFTIAHELCHVLFDRTRARRIAHASGQWAEPGIEQRANAFAAYLLMPRPRVFAQLAEPVDLAEVRRLATTLQVNETALVPHLCNLGFIDDGTRDRLIDEVRQAQRRAGIR